MNSASLRYMAEEIALLKLAARGKHARRRAARQARASGTAAPHQPPVVKKTRHHESPAIITAKPDTVRDSIAEAAKERKSPLIHSAPSGGGARHAPDVTHIGGASKVRESIAAAKRAAEEAAKKPAAAASHAAPAAKPAAKSVGALAKHWKKGAIGAGGVLAAIAAKKAHSHYKRKHAGADLEALAQRLLDETE